MAGTYRLQVQLTHWNSDVEFDYSKCQNTEGYVWTGGELIGMVPRKPVRLLKAASACCEICTREPRCTHYTAGSDRHNVEYKGEDYFCLLYAGAKKMVESVNKTVKSGVSRGEITSRFLGSGAFFAKSLHLMPEAGCSLEERTEKAIVPAPENLRVTLSTTSALTHTLDEASLAGVQLSTRDAPSQVCAMRGVGRVPPPGRWLDVSARVKQNPRLEYDNFLSGYCSPTPMGNDTVPLAYIGPVPKEVQRVVSDAAAPAPHVYYWQPYACDLHHFARQELRTCLAEKKLTRFAFSGDSVITSWGTGFFPLFYELLVGANHSNPKEPSWNENEKTFTFSKTWTADLEEVRASDVYVTDFIAIHKLWGLNFKQIKAELRTEADAVEDALAKNSDGRRPRLYFYTPPALVSERQEHDSLRRAQKVGEFLRKLLLPRGWVELDIFNLILARVYDSTCGFDGMHGHHNVRVMISQILANHLCFG